MIIKLTKMEVGEDNRFPPSSEGIATPGQSWQGEQSPVTPEPIVGKSFFISTYRTSLVQEILTKNTFRTLNSVYKWEIVNQETLGPDKPITPRNCQEVISKMMEKVPAGESDFLKDLHWNYNDAAYKAPEEQTQWIRTIETLRNHIPVPKYEWHFEILSIFTTRPIEELKKAAKS